MSPVLPPRSTATLGATDLEPFFSTNDLELQYDSGMRVGVSFVVGASLVSLLSLLWVFVFVIPRSKHFKSFSRTNIWGYFVSLLVANFVQSVAAVMSMRWVVENAPSDGLFCTFQAVLKQGGNVASAIWSFLMAVHLFNLLLLRLPSSKSAFIAMLILGWTMTAMMVILGPAISTMTSSGTSLDSRSPYFGLSGFIFCGITDDYPIEQFALEYLVEFLSAGFGFILCSLVVLRIRGNLKTSSGRWKLRWVTTRSNRWKISSRNHRNTHLDSPIVKVGAHMVCYPITYTVVIVPVALGRLSEYSGASVPSWATSLINVIFALNGFFNVLLLVLTHKFLPDPAEAPAINYYEKDHETGIMTNTGPASIPSHFRDDSLGSSTISSPDKALLGTGPEPSKSRFSL